MTDVRPMNAPGIQRRRLVAGTAWAVPSVILAQAAPAFSASGTAPTIVTSPACKNPGNSCAAHPKGYTIPATVCNTQGRPIYIYDVTYTNVQGTDLQFRYAPPPALPIILSPNQCVAISFNAASNSSANLAFTMDMVITWGAPDSPNRGKITAPIIVSATPPDCSCP